MAKRTQLDNSETKVIRRSQINFNPINPKVHSDEAVKAQKRNLKKVGFLGGVVWNESTGNLVDGHRRVQAMDSIYGYDGSAESDYEIKVESVVMDRKTEMEQTTYMAAGNTKYDLAMVADYIGEIDYRNIGIPESELDDILSIANLDDVDIDIEDPFGDILAPKSPKGEQEAQPHSDPESQPDRPETHPSDGETLIEPKEDDSSLSGDIAGNNPIIPEDELHEARTEHVKSIKQQVREKAEERERFYEATITLSFNSLEAKEDFCDMVGINPEARYAKGEEVLRMIQ